MTFEAIMDEKDFPKVFRTSMYDAILTRFKESQLQRAREKIENIKNFKTVQSALRRRAKKILDYAVDIVVTPDGYVNIRKV